MLVKKEQQQIAASMSLGCQTFVRMICTQLNASNIDKQRRSSQRKKGLQAVLLEKHIWADIQRDKFARPYRPAAKRHITAVYLGASAFLLGLERASLSLSSSRCNLMAISDLPWDSSLVYLLHPFSVKPSETSCDKRHCHLLDERSHA